MELLGIALYKQLLVLPKRCVVQSKQYARLAEVGRLETPKVSGKYETGQLILHRVFGYRGVVLFPWLARVYDRDLPPAPRASSADTTDESPQSGAGSRGEVRGRTHLFYQVLIDQRDSPYIRAQTEAVTFLGGNGGNNSSSNADNASSRSLYAIPGLDYVAHEDIIPWTPSTPQEQAAPSPVVGSSSANRQQQVPPLQHELFERFLRYTPGRDPPYVAQETLRAWHHKNHPWLELSDVHKETTERVRVTVIPFYMGCRETHTHHNANSSQSSTTSPQQPSTSTVYWWRYCIRLENLGPLTVQLRERHWRIFSLSGTLETVRGRGVVGQEPTLTPHHAPAFQYSSHVSLQAPSGHMWGTFRLEREDGYAFDCRIPPFSLESKATTGGSGQAGTPSGATTATS